MSENEVEATASNLKSMGINAIVVGHSIKDSPVISQRFANYGIKLIASDVGMSSYYTKGEPGKGGVKIAQRGDIYAQSQQGIYSLHKAIKVKEGDYVRVYKNGSWEIDWQIVSIEGKEVILARQVGRTVKRIKMKLDYLNKMNPRGGRSEK